MLLGRKDISCLNKISNRTCIFGPVTLPVHMHSTYLSLNDHSRLRLACRFAFEVSLNVTGAAHYVVMPANASLPTFINSQTLTEQAANTVFPGNIIAASGDMSISSPFTNYSQLVLVCPFSLKLLHNIVVVLFAIACALHCDTHFAATDEYSSMAW